MRSCFTTPLMTVHPRTLKSSRTSINCSRVKAGHSSKGTWTSAGTIVIGVFGCSSSPSEPAPAVPAAGADASPAAAADVGDAVPARAADVADAEPASAADVADAGPASSADVGDARAAPALAGSKGMPASAGEVFLQNLLAFRIDCRTRASDNGFAVGHPFTTCTNE